jgi:hypothetical protein
MSDGLSLPIVAFDQLYASNMEEFIDQITGAEGTGEKSESGKSKGGQEKSKKSDRGQRGGREQGGADLSETVIEVLYRVMQMADNVGSTDEHRAVNFLATRNRDIYTLTRDMYNQNYSFTGVESRTARLTGTRKIVDVIFTYTKRDARYDVEKWFVRVDVTEEFPFIQTILGRYFER